jgi:predicted nucleic acid-binding protein
MEKSILDTNVIIDFINKKPSGLNLDVLLTQSYCLISFITKLELLGYSKITSEEEAYISGFLQKITILPMSEQIERETIEIRRKTKLKLPDAIIAATAIVIGADVVTSDPHFLNCTYPALRIWKANKGG